MKGSYQVTETVNLEKRSRNSHVSGTMTITASVQMWNVKDITRKFIRSLYYTPGSLPTSPKNGTSEGFSQHEPMRLTSFITSELEILDDIAEADQLCHRAKCKNNAEGQNSSANSNKRTFRYLMVRAKTPSSVPTFFWFFFFGGGGGIDPRKIDS